MTDLDWANIVVAASFMVVAILVKTIKADKPNKLIGYRTKMSMLNQATWDMANETMSNTLLWMTLISFTAQVFVFFTIDKTIALITSALAFSVGMAIMALITEAKLKRHFHSDGSPKSVSKF